MEEEGKVVVEEVALKEVRVAGAEFRAGNSRVGPEERLRGYNMI